MAHSPKKSIKYLQRYGNSFESATEEVKNSGGWQMKQMEMQHKMNGIMKNESAAYNSDYNSSCITKDSSVVS